MSLATRCPACSTVFRVVQDQLKVSGGWVRCGHCHEVFNGLEALFELPPEPPAAPPEPTPPPASQTPAFAGPAPSAPSAPAPAPDPAPTPAASEEPGFNLDLSEPGAAEAAPTPPAPASPPAAPPEAGADPAPADATQALPDEPPAPPQQAPGTSEPPLTPPPSAPAAGPEAAASVSAPTGWPGAVDAGMVPVQADRGPAPASDAEPAATAPEDSRSGPDTATQAPSTAFAAWQAAAHAPATDDLQIEDEAVTDANDPAEAAGLAESWPPRKQRRSRQRRTPKPSFVRQAEQAALWRRPAMRVLLGITALLLGALLALQVAHQERDQIAARWPALQPGLRQWCELARCSLQAPRALTSLTLDSSALAHTPRPQVLRFEADLRNAAEHVVRAPALELSFTDNLGRPLARKVLLPEALAAPADGIPADGVWHIEAQLDTGELRIASFTAEIFYP